MSDSNKANAGLIILSVFLPIVGYILYFAKKDEPGDAAQNYLWSAVAGSIIGLVLMM